MNEYEYSGEAPSCAGRYLLPIVAKAVRALPDGSVVLDLGCGNGATLSEFRGAALQLAGLDLSSSGILVAKRMYPDLDVEVADVTGDLSAHRLVGRCDLVISTEVIEHVFLPRLFVANCLRFLRPGGRLVISTPYHGYLKNLALALSGKLDGHFTALWDFGHIKFWSRRTLVSLLTEAGFKVVSFHGAGRVPFLWKSMIVIAEKPTRAIEPA